MIIIELLLSIFYCVKPEDINREIFISDNTNKNSNLRKRFLNDEMGTKNSSLVNYYVPNMECYKSHHIVHCIIGGVFILIFIGFVYFIIQTSYHSKIFNTSITSKANSSFDKLLFLTKVILSFLYSFFGIKKNAWILIIFLCFFSFTLFYFYFIYYTYYDKTLHVLYSLLVVIFAWANIVLLLGKLLENTSFNGSIPLLILVIPILFLIIIFEEQYKKSILKYQLSHFSNGIEVLNQIRILLYLSNNIKSVRGTQILLNGYIQQYESTCSILQCPLKKYISQFNQGEEIYSFLYYHIEILFQISLSTFPDCILLRMSYCSFLFEYLNKKKKANCVLDTVCNYHPSFEQTFIIYHTKKIIEEHRSNHDNHNDIDAVSTISYKNNLIQFKNIMANITFLYIEFWTLLLISFEDQEHLTRLNDFGTKIISLVEELTKLLAKMQKVNPNNQELLYYYSDFLNNILNEKEKALTYKSKLADIKELIEINDINYFNLDIDALSSSDEYQYIVVSGSNEIFGTITTISLGLCLVLGYSKTELIGKSYDVIMPTIYQKMHKKLLKDKVDSFKNKYNNITSYNDYKPKFKDINSFVKTKARYLIYMPFQVTLIVTESHGISFIAKMNCEQLSTINNQSSTCYLLTNNTFIIQNFTVNSVNLLGMNSYALNNAIDVTGFIKQVYEDFLQEALEKEELTFEDKIAIKRHIINQKYKTTKSINWKFNELVLDQRFKSSSKTNVPDNNNEINRKNVVNDSFLLTISNVIISGKQEGYIFKLESQYLNQFLGLSQRISQTDMVSTMKRKMSEKTIFLLTTTPNMEIQYDKYKAFIPEGKASFMLDTQQMSFIHNPQNKILFREELKNKAIQKIKTQINKKETTTIINEESYADSSSDLSNGEDSSSIERSNEKEINMDNSIMNLLKQKENVNEDYYKVDFSKIKYSLYSYEKKMIVEVPNYQKKSKLEMKMFDDDQNEEKIKNTEAKKSFQNIDMFKDDEKNKNDFAQEELIKQQITTALSREESQTIIIFLKMVMIFSLVFLLAIEGCMFFIIYDSQITLVSSTTLILNTYKLLMNLLIGHSAIRDLSLLENENYTSYEGTREGSKADCLQTMADLYNETVSLINSLVVKDVYLKNEDFYAFYNETTEITIIKNYLIVNKYNLTLLSALTQASDALFHIINDNDKYIPTDDFVYFFINNINNNISIKLQKQITLLIHSFLAVISYKQLNLYALLGLVFGILIIIYITFSKAYQEVAQKKESYLEVFFEIEKDVIKNSLEKCENFARKIQLQSFTEFIVNDEEHDYYDIIPNKDIKRHEKKKNNVKNKNSKDTLMIKVFFGVFLILIQIYRSLYISFFFFFLENLKLYINIFQSENDAFLEYMYLYRNCREFFFDDNISINTSSVNDYFPNYLIDFYHNIIQKQNLSLIYKKKYPKKYLIEFERLHNKELCSNEMKDQQICQDETIKSLSIYGLNAICPFFIEEIRLLKNTKKLRRGIIHKLGFEYNLTLIGLEEYAYLFPDDPKDYPNYFEFSPLGYYNNNVYKRIKRIYVYFIVPSFISLFILFESCINDLIQTNVIIFYVVSGLVIFVIIILYLFVWRPFEQKLHSILFKTKNLLTIIPKEFLASLSNIQKLLNLNQSFSKKTSLYKK